jgi:hypothetical protein
MCLSTGSYPIKIDSSTISITDTSASPEGWARVKLISDAPGTGIELNATLIQIPGLSATLAKWLKTFASKLTSNG